MDSGMRHIPIEIVTETVAVGLGLISAYFGVAYILIWGLHPWPDFPWPSFWSDPTIGVLFVTAGLFRFGEGALRIGARRRQGTSSIR